MTGGFAQQSAKYNGTIKQENPLRYDASGSAPGALPTPTTPETPTVPAYTAAEQAQYSAVHPAGTAPEAQVLSTKDTAASFWKSGIPGFSVGGVQDTNSVENPYPTTTSDAVKATPIIQHMGGTSLQMGSETALVGGMSTAAAATAVGDTNVKVAAVTSGNPPTPLYVAGQPFIVDTGQSVEVGQIASVGTAGATGTGITLTAPLSSRTRMASRSGSTRVSRSV